MTTTSDTLTLTYQQAHNETALFALSRSIFSSGVPKGIIISVKTDNNWIHPTPEGIRVSLLGSKGVRRGISPSDAAGS